MEKESNTPKLFWRTVSHDVGNVHVITNRSDPLPYTNMMTQHDPVRLNPRDRRPPPHDRDE